jgi:hypothetical protein
MAKKMGQTHLAEEEEGGLLIVQASEFNLVPLSPSFKITMCLVAVVGGSPAAVPAPWDSIHLVEEKVFMQFGDEDAQVNGTRWVLDTGATNHMMGVGPSSSSARIVSITPSLTFTTSPC